MCVCVVCVGVMSLVLKCEYVLSSRSGVNTIVACLWWNVCVCHI